MPNLPEYLVVCNGAGKTDRCDGCSHAVEHPIVPENHTTCLAWGLCRRYGKPKMQVRCTHDLVKKK